MYCDEELFKQICYEMEKGKKERKEKENRTGQSSRRFPESFV